MRSYRNARVAYYNTYQYTTINFVVRFRSHHEMNPSKAEEMHSQHLESIKMQSYADQTRWGHELKNL